MDRAYFESQVIAIVDHIDETWTKVEDLIVEMDQSDHTQDACVDLDLRDIRYVLARMSNTLFRKNLPEVLDRHFREGPDPDAQRDDAQDRAMREAWGE